MGVGEGRRSEEDTALTLGVDGIAKGARGEGKGVSTKRLGKPA